MFKLQYLLHSIVILCILLFSNQGMTQATMLDDMEMQRVIKAGLDKMYNMEFEEAEKYFIKVKEKYPDHPAYELLESMSLTWEMMYFNTFKKKAQLGIDYLEGSLEKADKLLQKDKNDAEGVFFTLAGRASLALYHAQTDETMKAVNEARKAYSLIKKADKWKEKLIDFNFPVGLYNYYVVQYPENHPVFKPFMFFFYKGDKEEGLKLLDICSNNGVYSATESTYYLSHIYLRYEEDHAKSIEYSVPLTKKYPDNLYFKINLCEAYIGNGQYKKAEYLAYELYKSQKVVGQIAAFTFYGLLNEKYFKEAEKAKNYYYQALNLSKESEYPVEDFTSQCYAGLGRYYHQIGDKENAIESYKKCLKITDYLSLRKEAEDYLDKHD